MLELWGWQHLLGISLSSSLEEHWGPLLLLDSTQKWNLVSSYFWQNEVKISWDEVEIGLVDKAIMVRNGMVRTHEPIDHAHKFWYYERDLDFYLKMYLRSRIRYTYLTCLFPFCLFISVHKSKLVNQSGNKECNQWWWGPYSDVLWDNLPHLYINEKMKWILGQKIERVFLK